MVVSSAASVTVTTNSMDTWTVTGSGGSVLRVSMGRTNAGYVAAQGNGRIRKTTAITAIDR